MNGELCGDIQLSPADRLRYLMRNVWANIRTVGRGPDSRIFVPDLVRAQDIEAGQSPGRLLTELLFEAQLPRLISPRELRVIEIGCGSGSMVHRLARLGYRGRYTGVDINDRFRRDHPAGFPFAIAYHQIDAHAFAPSDTIDLMLSVSTLEHIPHDTALIQRLPSMFNPGGVEVHVVPSGASLMVYLWHGFRQYTPATLVMKFGREIELIRLGGLGSYLLHLVFITIPDLFFRRSWRKRAPRLYRKLLLGALRIDRLLPFFPLAYVVIRRH
jgi:2-polyprenyl-3-methyl-5-hydroxy-6-metoxy-1,4-benzoquinol methylase